jgi:hypothetical protein
MLSGMLEFGFALNQYLNALDAAREGARYASDGDPLLRGPDPTLPIDCTSTDYYVQTACVALETMRPVPLNPVRDDVVISVFRVLAGQVVGRWPTCAPLDPDDCPRDPPGLPETRGEWHLFGRGNPCVNGIDDDGDGAIDDGCVNPADAIGLPEETCDPATDTTCHPSHFTIADVEARLDPAAPNTAVMLVEVFYSYDMLLKLPWITAFVADPLPMHTYTIIPVPAAEPSLSISGHTTDASDGSPVDGVTVNFSNGFIAITDDVTGYYWKGGFDSGVYTVTPTHPLCTFTPASVDVTLSTADVTDVDFVAVCTPPPPPPPPPSDTPDIALPTATFTSTPTETPTSTPTETPTITPTPSLTPNCNGTLDVNASTVTLVTPPTGIVQSDGTQTVQVVVTAKDDCGNLMPNQPVSLSSSRGGVDIVDPSSATTDANGQAYFNVRSFVMSPWDTVGGNFSPSTLFAVVASQNLPDTADATFVCVRGVISPGGGPAEVQWHFINASGMTRRLIRLEVIWPQETGRLLQDVSYSGLTIWDLGTNLSPVTIDSNFLGGPTSRHINDTFTKLLQISFNFNVTGHEFTVKAFWDDTNGGSICDSGSITIIRSSVPTLPPPPPSSTPTDTTVPATATETATPTETIVPATATP